MFRSIYSKFIIGYVLFGLIGFIVVALFSQRMTYNYLVKQNADKLYDEAVLMASTYTDGGYYFNDINSETVNDLDLVAGFLNAQIWIVDDDGTVILDSNHSLRNGAHIASFNPAEDSGYYRIGNLGGMFGYDMLSVMAPINHDYETLGYILIHYPMSLVVASTNEILDIVYLTALIIFILSLVILVIFTLYVYIPLKAITTGAKEYAAGHLDYQIKPPSTHDEVRNLCDVLNYMAQRLETSEKSQRDFISNVSHDFRSPLTSIKGYLEAIIDGTIPPEMQEKYLKRVISETERLSKLTESMINLGTVEMKSRLKVNNFDINAVIRDVCNANENACLKKNIHFELTFENASEMVRADEEKIKQVLYNLIDNAVKFSNSNSSIAIKTYVLQKKVFVSVKDSGIGIPRGSIRKIWDRFYKTDTSRGRDKTGTGLGLSIVKEIIQLHNETIDVISTEGVGSEFIFSLPLGEET